jgi:iron complex transport system permease protein
MTARLAAIGALAAVAALLELLTGPVSIGAADALRALFGAGDELTVTIVRELRLPRMLLATAVGGGLATAGAVMQGLFRNPLAEPGVIGTSAGAGVGAVFAIFVGAAGRWSLSMVLFAFVGAVGGTLACVAIARRGGRMPMTSLLLAGLAVGSFAAALLSLMLMNTSHYALRDMMHWLLGGLDGRSMTHVALALPPILLGCAAMFAFARTLDAMALGEDAASSLGVDVERARAALLALAALVTAAAVSVAGIVGFVGLVVPHLLRMVVGPRHATLLPASFLGGALLLTSADLAARSMGEWLEIRLGVVTALIGAPFFLVLLRRVVREGRAA